MQTKPQPLICALGVQPYFLTVGKKDKPFKTGDDLWRFMRQECGFEGLTLPLGNPFIDVKKLLKSEQHRADFLGHFNGTTLPLLKRGEFHCDGQNVCLSPSRTLRMGPFITPRFRKKTHREIEKMAARNVRAGIDLSAACGFTEMVGFCGGRAYPVAQAKWSAWPPHLKLWAIAILAVKWESILEYAADRNVVLTFEIGHPENDLLTGDNFVLLWNLLSPKARKALGLQADASHFLNTAVNPMPHFRHVVEKTGCHVTNHYKWGAVGDKGNGTASNLGGWENWTTAYGSFYTIGTVGPEKLVRDYHAFNMERHEAQEGGLTIVYEGECVGLADPCQAMMVGADNCRALLNNTPLFRLDNVVPHDQPIQLEPFPANADSRPVLIGPDGVPREIAKWPGGLFDSFANTAVTAAALLGLHTDEIIAVRNILRRAGFDKEAGTAKK